MEELNFKEEELKGFKEFNKGGNEGKILLYKPEILLKRFEPFIMPFLNMDNKKYKLIEFSKMNQLENIIALPKQLVNIDNTFSGFTMKKYDAVTIDNLKDLNKNIDLFAKLFKNLDYLHNKDIIIGDVKNKNILVDNNNNPIFVDVDSMGINKFPQDHIDRGPAGSVRRIPNINKKFKSLDYKSLDKLLLLSLFVEKLADNKEPMVNKIYNSSLYKEAKEIMHEYIYSDKFNYNIDLAAVFENERTR